MKDKVLSNVKGWKVKVLSQAGHATLIKTMARVMPIYCMSSFLLPKGWCDAIDKILKDFWWGFSTHKVRNFTTPAWNDICLPKNLGGLGLRKMFKTNIALIAKLGWRIFKSPDCL